MGFQPIGIRCFQRLSGWSMPTRRWYHRRVQPVLSAKLSICSRTAATRRRLPDPCNTWSPRLDSTAFVSEHEPWKPDKIAIAHPNALPPKDIVAIRLPITSPWKEHIK